MQIIVTGCVAQAEGEEILKETKVDYIFGPQSFHKLPKILKKSNSDKVYNDFLCENKFSSLIPSKSKEVSKLITIQEGCDKFVHFV